MANAMIGRGAIGDLVDMLQAALATANRAELSAGLGLALCFDIHVLNGGVDSTRLPKTAKERDRRLNLARAKYRDDAFSCKSAIAIGEGVVRGQPFNRKSWRARLGLVAVRYTENHHA